MSRVRVYWWREQPNFGDAMNPVLLERLFGVTVEWAPLLEADLTASGSVIQWITPAVHNRPRPIRVWGSGFIHDLEAAPPLAEVAYHAIRGPRSRTLAGANPDTPLGDPGLLCPEAFGARPTTTHAIGVVPHLWDLGSLVLAEAVARSNALLIDVRQDPEVVISQIASCEHVFSSSLHGLIVADSYDVATTWFTSTELFGGTYKFDDYHASVGMTREPHVLSPGDDLVALASRWDGRRPNGLSDLRDELYAAFPTFD
ncbi:hypothetical protein ASC64_06555 [Nocardioides sp. Root122]|uniref:polysaccharide pyruvyl transferase family protein n=1 Tax=Nocardioides TaxID=1839 RepID=UPI00070361E8|nr:MULTISPECIES: polysaccharide pyruvyl transferase family protein [Nocardioides]KQV69503.1 hypothetical protein ASC64_06555 [Nocardioides sp. Root122]MCK9824280.1 polysaccharide pyruvyl transferase family protein [Nocardioides cavernae]